MTRETNSPAILEIAAMPAVLPANVVRVVLTAPEIPIVVSTGPANPAKTGAMRPPVTAKSVPPTTAAPPTAVHFNAVLRSL